MKLHEDWRRIVRRAWSFRLMALAAMLSGAEVILPLFMDSIPRNLFAALSFVAVGGGLVARLVAQSKIENGNGA